MKPKNTSKNAVPVVKEQKIELKATKGAPVTSLRLAGNHNETLVLR